MMDGFKYCIDFDALYYIYNATDLPALNKESIHHRLGNCILEGSIVIPHEVYREISKKDAELAEFLKPYRELIRRVDPDIESKLRMILKKFPTLVDIELNRIQADPFLFATSLVENRKIITARSQFKSLISPYQFAEIASHLNISLVPVSTYITELSQKNGAQHEL